MCWRLVTHHTKKIQYKDKREKDDKKLNTQKRSIVCLCHDSLNVSPFKKNVKNTELLLEKVI